MARTRLGFNGSRVDQSSQSSSSLLLDELLLEEFDELLEELFDELLEELLPTEWRSF